MSTPEVPMIGLSLGKHFNRVYTQTLIWYSIIHPNRMLNCKIPKGKIVNPMLCTIQWRAYHKRVIHVHNGLDITLRLSVLMLSPNSGETLVLALAFAIIAVFICHKHTVINMLMLDIITCLFSQPLFKSVFSQHSFICSEWDLILNPNQTRHSIIKDVTALKSILTTFATKSRWKYSRCAYN